MLLRHAKSERGQPGERDHDRVLAPRGQRDAPALGAFMVKHALIPDLAVVSTAARTRETWELAVAAFPQAPPVTYEDRIYEATANRILQVIKDTPVRAHTLLIVGHNPGLQDLATLLIATGDLDARQRLTEAFPTSALAVIDFPLDAWSKLHAHSGRLDRYVTPRSLAAATD
jgi:phosphohistidine phosphatase